MKKNAFLLMVYLLATTFVYAQKLALDTQSSILTYKAKHMAHAWEGSHQKLQGLAVIDGQGIQQIAVKGAIRDFDSNNANRDSHALEVLEALQFPEVRFSSGDIQMLDSNQVQFNGSLVFHGISLPKAIEAQYEKTENGFHLSGTFDFQATDFEVDLPSFLLVKINDRIIIDFDLNFVTRS